MMNALAALQELDAEQVSEVSGTLMMAVIIGYLIMLLIIGGIGFKRGKSTEEDYYLAGRGQGWIVSSLTIMATFFSSFALLGAPGLVYREGVVFALFALNVPVAGFAVYVLGSRIYRIGKQRSYVTPADMICDYYDSPAGLRILAALIGFLYAVPYVVIQIKAGGYISRVMFPDTPSAYYIGTIALALVTVIYIMVGGMRSVAWSDVIQGSLLMGGMLIAGAAAVYALGGFAGFFDSVNKLPDRSLTVPGTTGGWTATKLMTVCIFGSVGSMIQPAQWMRYYAAKSPNTLRRSALIFGTALPICFLFGVMLVGMGGQALYPIVDADGNYAFSEKQVGPDGEEKTVTVRKNPDKEDVNWRTLQPHPEVGSSFDQILVVVLKKELPRMLGPIGAFLTALIVVAIMAASMSTADSNLHSMSAVFTRDIYTRYIRKGADEKEKTWVGRFVILGATALAIGLIMLSEAYEENFNIVAQIARLGLLAIAFSSQLLPVTIDILFIRKGTRAGAIAGILTGIGMVFLFTPFYEMIFPTIGALGKIRATIDLGAFGFIGNVIVFAVVSAFTKKVDPQRSSEFVSAMTGRKAE